MDTSFTYWNDGTVALSSDERKWQNKMIKLAEERPDEVTILHRREDVNGHSSEGTAYLNGYVVATFPAKWLKIRPNRILTEEQKRAVRDRLKKKS